MEISQVPWTEIGLFWISLVLVLITVSATIVNYIFFRSQVDPDVIIYVSPDENRPSFILLIVENIGHGLAKDISFSISNPIPQKAFGFSDAPVPKQMDFGPLINGIPALGPGSKRIITWGQFGGLTKGIGDEIIYVTITFKSDHIFGLGNRLHKTVCPIDVKSFEGTDASDINWEKKTAQNLEKISKSLNQFATDFRSLKIEMKENGTNQTSKANNSSENGEE